MQRAFWLREVLSGDGGLRAAVAFGVDFEGPVDLDRLDGALGAVLDRHPLLRARFVAEHGELSYRVEARPGTILTRLPGPAALAEWCARPVAMLNWPLCRAAVASDGDRTRLRVVIHHAACDAQSKDVFLRDLCGAYASRAPLGDGHGAPSGGSRVRASSPSPSGVCGDDVRPPETVSFEVDPALTGLVAEAAARLGVSKFTVHLAAWHAALARLRFEDGDVVTPIALSTRTPADEAEIGPFLNQLPVRSTSTRDRRFSGVVLELSGVVRGLVADRHKPPATVAPPAEPGPVAAVSYRRDTLGDLVWPDATAIPLLLPPLHAVSSDVVIRMLHHGPSTSGRLDVDREALPPGYAARLERCWRALLRAGAQRLDARIGELPLMEVE